MAAPNLINANTIIGRTAGATLTTTNPTTILPNPENSNKCFKINTLNVCNSTNSPASITVYWNTTAGVTLNIVGNVPIPAGSTLNVIDKTSQYYLEENTSLGATAGTANALVVTVSYEDIS